VRKSLTVWLGVLVFGAWLLAAPQTAEQTADRTGTWTGTWEGAGGTGGFELTLEKPKDGALGGKVSVTGEPAYQATLKTAAIDGNKLTATYDFPIAEGAEVSLTCTFEEKTCKGTWVVREKATGNAAVDGTWTVTKK
jgi:hypothetical protein